MTQSHVLVTGSAGFIGCHLAVALHRAGHRVTSVDVRPADAAVRECGDFLRCDFRDPLLLDRVRGGAYQAVVHQAGISNTLELDRAALTAVNLDGALALADACATSGATFVYASSFSVYGRTRDPVPIAETALDAEDLCSGPLNPYAESKLALDRAMSTRDAPARWAGLRYTNVFAEGERQRDRASSVISQILGRAARGEPVDVFADTLLASRDYVPVGRVCAAVRGLLAGDFPSGVYNVGAGVALSFAALLQWCTEFDGAEPVTVRLVPNPIPARYQYWTCADTSRLDSVLSGLFPVPLAELRDEARRLFERARRGGPE